MGGLSRLLVVTGVESIGPVTVFLGGAAGCLCLILRLHPYSVLCQSLNYIIVLSYVARWVSRF